MTKRTGIEKMKPGPKLVEINPVEITKWASVGWRWVDIAAELEMGDRTLRRYRAVDPQLDLAYTKGVAKMRRSLRAKQYKLAMAGNVTMLIWLGKNELEQSDKKDLRSLHLHADVGADPQDSLAVLTLEEVKERRAVLREMKALEDGVIDIEVEENVPSLDRA